MSFKFWLLVAGTGVGEAGDLGALKDGDEFALRGFLVDVFPDGLALGVENLKAETIETGLQPAVRAVPDDDAGKIMLGTEVDFPEGGGVTIVVVGDTLGLEEITIRIAVNGEPCVSVKPCRALSCLASECHVFAFVVKGLDLGDVEDAVLAGKLDAHKAAALAAAAIAVRSQGDLVEHEVVGPCWAGVGQALVCEELDFDGGDLADGRLGAEGVVIRFAPGTGGKQGTVLLHSERSTRSGDGISRLQRLPVRSQALFPLCHGSLQAGILAGSREVFLELGDLGSKL